MSRVARRPPRPGAGGAPGRPDLRAEYGHIDVLVNDIWGGELLKGGPAEWNTPIWELDLDDGLRLLRLAIDTHLITSHHLLPLLVDQPGGLRRRGHRRHHRAQRVALPHLRLLRPGQGGGEPARVLPGPRAGAVRRDGRRAHAGMDALGDDAGGVQRHRGRTGATRSTASEPGRPSAPPDFALSESPRFVGRAVAALAADPDRARWNQQSLTSGALAQEYGFTDVDGSRPDVWRFIEDVARGRPRGRSRRLPVIHAEVASRCCRRSWAASSTALWRHSDARYTHAMSPLRCTRRKSPYTNA